MKSLLPFVPLLALSAIVLFIASRPKNGGPLRLKHGIGVLLAILGTLSLVGQLFIDPVTNKANLNVWSIAISLIFIAVGMFLSKRPKPAAPKNSTDMS